jgi:molecular chaperone HtpG
LKQYVDDLRPNQTEIYYLAGESLEQLKSNPVLEAARARDIEVLLLTDHVDAFWTTLSLDFDGKPLKSLSQGDVNLDIVPLVDESSEDKDDNAQLAAIDEAVVLSAVKAAIGDHVTDVKASKRLTDSPACLVAGQTGPDRRLERILTRGQAVPHSKPVLELNMKHKLVRAIADAKAAGNDQDVTDLAHLLFEQAQILDGEIPSDPAAFARRTNRLVERGLGGSPQSRKS